MRHGTKADAAQVPVKLTVEEIADRGESMAQKLLHINALRASRLDAMQKSQKLIDNELDELGRLARVVMDSSELRRQGDLFADQMPDKGQAQEVLAEVAKRAAAAWIEQRGGRERLVSEMHGLNIAGWGSWLEHQGTPVGVLDELREDLEREARESEERRAAIGKQDPKSESAGDEIKKRREKKRKERLEQVGAPEEPEARA